MIIDLGPIIYGILLIYVVGGILCAVVLSLGAWGLTTLVKRLREPNPRNRAERKEIGSFSPAPQHGRA